MSVETIARRYGTALADVVAKTGEAETVNSELLQWETMLASNQDLQDAFANPAISHLNKENVLEKLIEKSRPSKTTANFLRVLLRNNRLAELGEINEKFAEVREERNGIVSARITSARNLGDGERSALKTNLEKLTGKTVKLNFEIDSEIIGGVVTRIGSTVYDSSVKTKIENLKTELIGT